MYRVLENGALRRIEEPSIKKMFNEIGTALYRRKTRKSKGVIEIIVPA